MKNKTPEKLPIHLFICGHEDCKKLDDMPPGEFKKHLKDVHSIISFKGTKQAILFLDGRGWYSQTYQWKLEVGLDFMEVYKGSKSKL